MILVLTDRIASDLPGATRDPQELQQLSQNMPGGSFCRKEKQIPTQVNKLPFLHLNNCVFIF